LLETDKYIMRTKSKEIISVMQIIGKEVQAERIVLALKQKYKKEIECLQKIISNSNSKVELYFIENFYPAGDEQILVYEITGRTIPSGGIPLDAGVLVSNVGTMHNIYEASLNKPVIYKYISILGEVKYPGIVKVPIGTSVDECIQAVGGVTVKDYCLILGGPMMGRIIESKQEKDVVVTKTLGSIIVLPMLLLKQQMLNF